MDWPALDPEARDLAADGPRPPEEAGAGRTSRPPDGQAHGRELALFLAVHYGRAPGVLWPEHDLPSVAAGPDGIPLLARQLALLTGLPVAGCHGSAAREGGHLLVYQLRGSRTWTLTGPGAGGARRFCYRLRAGEVLYVPDRWARRPAPLDAAALDAVLLLRPAVC
ncbi:hypothetical protein [Streptomyces sp. NPDC089799]|uniref:hypothetical protein n=1 Tax=Streptomyces sp. NPDC089799 TaxID=3155066 RepID=UPI00344535C7